MVSSKPISFIDVILHFMIVIIIDLNMFLKYRFIVFLNAMPTLA